MLDGAVVPFSKFNSYYKVQPETGLIYWARDCAEPGPPKPADSSVAVLGGLIPVFRKLGDRADPAQFSSWPFAAAAMWLFYAGMRPLLSVSYTHLTLPTILLV